MDIEGLRDEAKALSARKQQLQREQQLLATALQEAEAQHKDLSARTTVRCSGWRRVDVGGL